MAKKKASSAVLAKLKKRGGRSWKKAREAEGQAKGSTLPGGIVRGVAQLTGFKLDVDKKGNPYVFLQAKVAEPEEYAGVKTSIQHFIRATENKTVEDKLEGLVSDMKLLGADTVEDSDIDDLPDILGELAEAQPMFYFNTWAPEDGGTYVFIQGLAEDQDEPLPDEDEDEDPEDDEEEDEAEDEDSEDEEDESEDEDEEETEDEDEEEEEEEEPEDEEEDWVPDKEDVYMLKPSPRAKPAEFEVKTVNKTKKTVSGVFVKSGKKKANVPWDNLEGDE